MSVSLIRRANQMAFMISPAEKACLVSHCEANDITISQIVRRCVLSVITDNTRPSDVVVGKTGGRDAIVNLKVSDEEKQQIMSYAKKLGISPSRLVRDALLVWLQKTFPELQGASDQGDGAKSEADRCTTTLPASKQGSPYQG